jgi:DNA-binding CsgD family transcriptional regulator
MMGAHPEMQSVSPPVHRDGPDPDGFRGQSHPARQAGLRAPGRGGPRDRGVTMRYPRRVQPSGGSLFSDNIWRLLAGSLKLSQRESQILPAVFDEQNESTIAVSLGISSHTVHTHLERLYRKLGVTSRVSLVTRVFVEYLWLEEGHRRTLGIPRQDRQNPATHG